LLNKEVSAEKKTIVIVSTLIPQNTKLHIGG